VRPRSGSIRAGAAKTPSRASYCFPVVAVEDAAVLRVRSDGKTNDAWLSQTVADPGPDQTGPLGGASSGHGSRAPNLRSILITSSVSRLGRVQDEYLP
jgi:hypothetical protein